MTLPFVSRQARSEGRTKGKGVRCVPGQVSNEASRRQGEGGAPAKPKPRYPICVGTLRICSDVPLPKRGGEMKLLIEEWGVGVSY